MYYGKVTATARFSYCKFENLETQTCLSRVPSACPWRSVRHDQEEKLSVHGETCGEPAMVMQAAQAPHTSSVH